MSDLCRLCSDIGQCCRYVELPLARALTADEQNWVSLHPGLWVTAANVVHIEVKCSALTDTGMCSLYGTEARPTMCCVWPDHPEQVPAGCAYADVFSGSGSPLESMEGTKLRPGR